MIPITLIGMKYEMNRSMELLGQILFFIIILSGFSLSAMYAYFVLTYKDSFGFGFPWGAVTNSIILAIAGFGLTWLWLNKNKNKSKDVIAIEIEGKNIAFMFKNQEKIFVQEVTRIIHCKYNGLEWLTIYTKEGQTIRVSILLFKKINDLLSELEQASGKKIEQIRGLNCVNY